MSDKRYVTEPIWVHVLRCIFLVPAIILGLFVWTPLVLAVLVPLSAIIHPPWVEKLLGTIGTGHHDKGPF